MYDARVDFWEKWREFLGGGNDIWVFLQKGKHPHQAEQKQKQAEQEAEQRAEYQSRSRAAHEKTAKLRIAAFIFHWKLFPSNAIARLKY